MNWTVEDGLIQSQASFICQDKYRQLWIGTEGGISKFDGKKFIGYSVQEGLIANHINILFFDKNGYLWIGTNYGISVFDGHSFRNIKLSTTVNNVSAIVQTSTQSIYVLNNYKLYKIDSTQVRKITISGDTTERLTTIYQTGDNLLTYVFGKGLYIFKNNSWSKLSVDVENEHKSFLRDILVTLKKDTLLLFADGLYCLKKNKIVAFNSISNQLSEVSFFCMEEDSKNNLWLGSEKGVYKLEKGYLFHFNAKSGFTDNSVNHIYRDSENNLWFATDADGIYKFRENTFTYYDKSSGLENTIVMGVTQTLDGTIYAAGYGGGLYKLNSNHDLEKVNHKGPVLESCKINSLYSDNENNLWIGTLNNGALRYHSEDGLKRIVDKNKPEIKLYGATSFLKTLEGNLLIGNSQGLFLLNKDSYLLKLKTTPNFIVTALKRYNNDSIIIGTSKGVYILGKDLVVKEVGKHELNNSSILCLAITSNNIWMGTTDKGVINWNLQTGRLTNYNSTDGLPSNFIYSIYVSNKQKAWIGTGFGISNLQLDEKGKIIAIKNYGRSDGLLGMECSHNCVLSASDSSLWFGTTKGLFHFNPITDIAEKNSPLVLLKSVKLFSSEITDTTLFKTVETWFQVPQKLKLASKQNHLTFELGSIFFTNPDDVLFKYKLDGIDKDYTTTNNPTIIYPALPPGKYKLMVIGVTKNGASSINEIQYAFEIEKAFYQTRFFQLLMIVIIILISVMLTYIFTRGRQKRKQKAKELFEKIREEEFLKLRQRTAEDFHDEMGNSLTRISILTDVLKSKLQGRETEINKLVTQIKENTSALYSGSRDIIWSLNAQNDGLYEITEHIKEIGIGLFEETSVDFNHAHNIELGNKFKLKLDYSRNLTMVFKEAYSNILKHSFANKVEVSINLEQNKELTILIKDNGMGFDTSLTGQGNGIKNMQNRIERMNGHIKFISAPGRGTDVIISLTNIFA